MKYFSTHILISPPGLPRLLWGIYGCSRRRRIGVGHWRCVALLWRVIVVRMQLTDRGRRDARILLASCGRKIRCRLSLDWIARRWGAIWLIVLLSVRVLAIRRLFSRFLT